MKSDSKTQEEVRSLHVLIVGKSKYYSESLKKVLEGKGFTANICLVVDEVMDQVAAFEPQLVFIEENLEKGSGIDLIRKVKTFNPNIKSILITDHPTVQSSVDAFRQGASDYLQQPIAEEDLLLSIDHCLSPHWIEGGIGKALGELGGRHSNLSDAGWSLMEILKWMDEAQRLGKVGHWVWDEIEDRELVASRQSLYIADTLHLSRPPSYSEFLEKLHPEDRERVDRDLRAASDTGKSYECEYRIILQDGGVRNVIERGEPVFGEDGVLMQTLGSVQDVTEHREREQALLISEERFKDAARTAKLGHWVYDEIADKLSYCSDEMARIHDKSREETISEMGNGEKDVKRLHPDDQDDYRKKMWAMEENPAPYDLEYRIIRPNGKVRYIRETGTPDYDESGVMVRSHGTIQDISEQKQMHEKLHDAVQRAEISNHAKSQFLAMMSHEIRTPINAVLGFLGLLSETELDVDQTKYSKSSRLSAELLLEIINDILDFVQMEAGKLNFENAPFELGNLAEGVIDVLSIRAQEKGITIETDISYDVPRYLEGDAGRLRQILINLANNAIKYTDEGRVRIVISTERETEKEATLRFEVIDTGIGISAEDHDQLFSEFITLSPTYTQKFGGTGLGLAISKRLVGMMDGVIDFSSEKGSGSTFWFIVTLPKITTSKAMKALRKLDSPLAPKLSSLNGSILLAEDNPANQMVAKTILEKAGLTVDVASNGLEALDAVKLRPYDLVLMDVGMPEMDGTEATHAIRQLDSTSASIPIIAMTAHVMSGDRESLLDQGMDDYLSKPSSKLDMLSMVHKWLDTVNRRSVTTDTQGNDEKSNKQEVILGAIDYKALIQLGEDTDPDLLPELIDKFVANMDERAAAMGQAIAASDMKQLKEDAHSMKGSSATFGASGLNKLAEKFEIAVEDGDVDYISRNSHLIADECEATKIKLASFLEGYPG
ncbi:MAG: response regulator [Bacteroidetes Order II. Incertae sedis bacterium]|nr:response regulator [Bacteroidetes Order II. bacterium]MBT7625135.1 response regulator [Pseudomonadota bacterium]